MQAAYYALHYGADYLPWSIRSIEDAVDEIHVFYVDRPSYGHLSASACPDSRDMLHEAAHRFSTKPIHWHDCGGFHNEGDHRGHAVRTLVERGAHQILVVDSDEVWPKGEALRTMLAATTANRARNWSAPFVHFIRSTTHAVRDHFRPIRIIDLRHKGGDDYVGDDYGPVLHFGYAQRTEMIRYKWTCHGHQAELRPGWLDRFSDWTPESRDLHPVVIELWDQATEIDSDLRAKVVEALKGHDYLVVPTIP